MGCTVNFAISCAFKCLIAYSSARTVFSAPRFRFQMSPSEFPVRTFSFEQKEFLSPSLWEALELILFMFPCKCQLWAKPQPQNTTVQGFRGNSGLVSRRIAWNTDCPQAQGIGQLQEAARVPALEQFPLLLWVKHSFTAGLSLANGHVWPWFSLQKEAVVGMI